MRCWPRPITALVRDRRRPRDLRRAGPDAARRMLRERKVDLCRWCADRVGPNGLTERERAASLWAKLNRGEVPAWLARVNPRELSDSRPTACGPDREGRMSDASASVINPRIVLPALSILLLGPVVMANYWPDGNGVDVVGYHRSGGTSSTSGPDRRSRLRTDFGLWRPRARTTRPSARNSGGCCRSTAGVTRCSRLFVFWPLAQLPYFVALAVWTLACSRSSRG